MEKKQKLIARIRAILDMTFDPSQVKGVIPIMDNSSTESAKCLPSEQCLPMALLCAEIVLTVKRKPKEKNEHPYVSWARKCTNNLAWLSYFGYTCSKRVNEWSDVGSLPEFGALKDLLYKNYDLFEKAEMIIPEYGGEIKKEESKSPFPNEIPSKTIDGINIHGWNIKALWTRWYVENVFNEFSHSIVSISKYDGARSAYHQDGRIFEPA